MLRRFLRHLVAFARDETGALNEVVAIPAVILLILAAGSASWVWVRAQSAQTAVGQVGSQISTYLSENGCLTTQNLQSLTQYAQQNGLNPAKLYLSVSSGRQGYGSGGLSYSLGYDFDFEVPLLSVSAYHEFIPYTVPAETSQYVAGASSDTSQCATGSGVLSTFSGQAGGDTTGATGGVSGPSDAATVTLSGPTHATAGETVAFQGAVTENGSPAPDNTQVVVTGPTGITTATTQAGDYSVSFAAKGSGNVIIAASAGGASATATLDVSAGTPQTIALQYPQKDTVGSPITIGGTVTDQVGDPVSDGTAVDISGPGIPAGTTATTSDGTFSFSYTPTSLAAVQLDFAAAAALATASIEVDPGPAQTITLEASQGSQQGSQITVTAGAAVTLSGDVAGPDNTPVEDGTQVVLSSSTDSTDTFPTSPTTAGAYSAQATLTAAGGQVIAATSAGITQPASVTVKVLPAAPAEVASFAVQPQEVEVGGQVAVSGILEDSYGNPVPDAEVTVSGQGIASASATTAADGTFTVTTAATSAGTTDVQATYQNQALVGGSAQLSVLAQSVYNVAVALLQDTIAAGGSTTATITVTDQHGNPVSGETLDLTESPQGQSVLSEASVTTDANGQATVTIGPLTQAGAQTLEVDTNPSGSVGSAVVTVLPAVPDTVDPPEISPSVVQSTQDGGSTYPVITGVALDQYGNPVAGAAVTVTGGWDPGVDFTGTANAEGYFAITLTPVAIGGPYEPTITVQTAQGSNTQTYSDTSLSVVQNLYSLSLTSLSGASVPAGTPATLQIGLTAYGTASSFPMSGATVSCSVTSSDGASAWSTSAPTPSGPATLTLTTDAEGQATAQVAFEPYLGAQTVDCQSAALGVSAALNLTVTSNAPAVASWTAATPNPVSAGQPFAASVTLLDGYGFPLAAGEPVVVSFPGSSGATWLTSSGGAANGSLTSTVAGSGSVAIASVGGQAVSGLTSSAQVPVDPGPLRYFYPVLGDAGDQWLSGYSWTNDASSAQGPTNDYGGLTSSPATVAGIGFDGYGNQVPGATATLSCTAYDGGTCPAFPGSASGSWQSLGGFSAGAYDLSFTPSGSSYGVASSPETTYTRFAILGTTLATSGSETWTTPGVYTFVVPNGVTRILGDLWGAGGGGGGGEGMYYYGGGQGAGGGGSGGFTEGWLDVSPGQRITLDVGAGGAGGPGGAAPSSIWAYENNGSPGTSGGSSSVATLTAAGGAGGGGGAGSSPGGGGAGGAPQSGFTVGIAGSPGGVAGSSTTQGSPGSSGLNGGGQGGAGGFATYTYDAMPGGGGAGSPSPNGGAIPGYAGGSGANGDSYGSAADGLPGGNAAGLGAGGGGGSGACGGRYFGEPGGSGGTGGNGQVIIYW